jgi:AcrR family transcriptional regulator
MEQSIPADERILRAALCRVAADGLGAPLRAVAQDAGVSAGLIIHHYGSREKLLEACDRRALEVTREQKKAAIAGGAGTVLAQLAAAEQYAPVVGYVLRRLQAGGPLAERLIEDFIDNAEEYYEEGVRAGVLSPSRDPRARVRVLTHMSLGSLVLQLPGQDARIDLAELPRWMREYTDSLTLPLMEIFTTPLLTDASLLDSYLAAHGAPDGEDAGPAPTAASAAAQGGALPDHPSAPTADDPPTDRSTP